jgi:uncharacterized protein (TIGR02246 family)
VDEPDDVALDTLPGAGHRSTVTQNSGMATLSSGADAGGMKAAKTPQAVHEVLADAMSRGDIESFVAVYDEDAVLIAPPDGTFARGRAEIRAAVAPMLTGPGAMTSTVRRVLEGPDLAITQAEWTFNTLSGRGAIVSRRRPDGTWGVVLDDPMSAW